MVEEKTVMQNSFSRSTANDAKAGFYPTDPEHCLSAGSFFDFPDEEVCAFDCCAGKGRALLDVTSGAGEKAKLFANDLNAENVAALKAQEGFEAVVCSDYLKGFEAKNGFFTFFWCNPPYGETREGDRPVRYERLFMEKLHIHLAKGAVGCFVFPEYVFGDEKFAKLFLGRYALISIYRFREPVYRQFRQCIAFVRKKDGAGYSSEELSAYLNACTEMTALPVSAGPDGRIPVLPSYARELGTFRCRKFNADDWLEDVAAGSSLDPQIGKWLSPKEWSDEIKQRPPIVLGDSHLAMMATCGKGAGAVGSEEEGDYHLQRGSVKRTRSERTEMKNGKPVIVETDHASINIRILEQVKGDDGKPKAVFTDLV